MTHPPVTKHVGAGFSKHVKVGCQIVAAICACLTIALTTSSALSAATPNTALKVENGVLTGFADGARQHPGANVVVPANVTQIADNAFDGQQIASVDFRSAKNLKKIGDFAFSKNKLTQVEYPNLNDDTLGWYVFSDNPITSVTFANGVTHINDGAFANNNQLTSIQIPATMASIGDWTFSGCRIQNINLTPMGGTRNVHVGSGAFYGNQATTITLPTTTGTRWYGYEAFGQNNTNLPVGSQFEFNHNADNTSGVISNPNDFAYDSQYPTVITGLRNGVSGAGKTIQLPANVTGIAENAFNGVNLSGVDFSRATKLKTIGNMAFYANHISGELVLPASLNRDRSGIGWYAFASNNITSVNFSGNTVTSLNDFVFANNMLKSINLPATLTQLGDGTFINNQIADVTLPSGLTHMGSGTFAGNAFSEQRAQELTKQVNQIHRAHSTPITLYPFGNAGAESTSGPAPAPAPSPAPTKPAGNRFVKEGNAWKYLDKNGVALTGSHVIDGRNYFFYNNGIQVKDRWVEFQDGTRHYFNSKSGALSTTPVKPKNCFIVTSDGNWKYLDKHSNPVTGEQWIDHKHYFFRNDGTQIKGEWVTFKNGTRHFFDINTGEMTK